MSDTAMMPVTRARRAGNAGRAVTRGLGELFITLGLLLLLFVAYQLVWTNVEAAREQGQVADAIRDSWQRPGAALPDQQDGDGKDRTGKDGKGKSDGKKPAIRQTAVDFGSGFAFLRIPRLGENYTVPILEGVDLEFLARGVGHYPQTALPGQVGNFAVAGHRATNGEPFAYLDRLRPGDAVVVETRGAWLTYVVDRTRIVSPSDVWVLDPVPGQPGAQPTEQLITLTTCNPRWASYERLIVFGHLESRRDKADGPPPELRQA